MSIRLTLVAAFGLAVVTSCTAPVGGLPSSIPGPSGSPPPATSGTMASATNVATPVPTISASSGSASSAPGGTPTPTVRPSARSSPSPQANGLITITKADAGSTIDVAIGQRVLIELGVDLDWTVTISDSMVLARVPGITVVRGAQGLYVGQHAGRATISAVGDPPCRKSTPPCMAPSLLITVTVVVS